MVPVAGRRLICPEQKCQAGRAHPDGDIRRHAVPARQQGHGWGTIDVAPPATHEAPRRLRGPAIAGAVQGGHLPAAASVQCAMIRIALGKSVVRICVRGALASVWAHGEEAKPHEAAEDRRLNRSRRGPHPRRGRRVTVEEEAQAQRSITGVHRPDRARRRRDRDREHVRRPAGLPTGSGLVGGAQPLSLSRTFRRRADCSANKGWSRRHVLTISCCAARKRLETRCAPRGRFATQ